MTTDGKSSHLVEPGDDRCKGRYNVYPRTQRGASSQGFDLKPKSRTSFAFTRSVKVRNQRSKTSEIQSWENLEQILFQLPANQCVTVGSRKMNRLLFAADLMLLVYYERGIQDALHDFAAGCNQAGTNINTEKTEISCLSRNTSQLSVRFRLAAIHISRSRSMLGWGGTL